MMTFDEELVVAMLGKPFPSESEVAEIERVCKKEAARTGEDPFRVLNDYERIVRNRRRHLRLNQLKGRP
jgi:hypothetical protein